MLDALREGFFATLIEDASRPLDINSFGITKKQMTENAINIINSRDL